jgi:nucleoside phosphorylase
MMPDFQADLLVVTTTPVEGKAVLQVFKEATGRRARPESLDERIYFDMGEVNGARVYMICTEISSRGPGDALPTVYQAILALSPAAVVIAGIALGANPKKQAIGDILVAQQLCRYGTPLAAAEGQEGQSFAQGDPSYPAAWLVNHFKSADLLWEGASVRFGRLLSGEVPGQTLRAIEPGALGGELEGAGLYLACQQASVDWLLVKGIAAWDTAPEEENDQEAKQVLAARNAAGLLLHA